MDQYAQIYQHRCSYTYQSTVLKPMKYCAPLIWFNEKLEAPIALIFLAAFSLTDLHISSFLIVRDYHLKIVLPRYRSSNHHHYSELS